MQQSSYAKAGGIPVAVLGLVAYVGVLLTAAVRGVPAALAGAVISLTGVAFSGYLLWAQLARIHAICQWYRERRHDRGRRRALHSARVDRSKPTRPSNDQTRRGCSSRRCA